MTASACRPRPIRAHKLSDTANTVLVKVNQAGTTSRTEDALAAAQATGLGVIVSARSGETEDTRIVHVAVVGAQGS